MLKEIGIFFAFFGLLGIYELKHLTHYSPLTQPSCTWSKWNLANFFALMAHLPWTSSQHSGLLSIRPEYK